MKAFTTYQPWASFLILGIKTFETKRTPFSHRGPIVIHAANTLVDLKLLNPHQRANVEATLRKNGLVMEELPLGRALGVAEMIDCHETSSWTRAMNLWDWRKENRKLFDRLILEFHLGNFGPGRWAWDLQNPRPFVRPLAWKGAQGIWNFPDSVIAEEETKWRL